ncbi:alpha/beta fold hydrolase [Pseudonocardia spinosispora]|uniref:alpha/beta fold hydrolase n=1 Tax=Pseudonocardia spinosispora TaxID=103441 RepID=UPI00040EDA94|nr:alpha/beta hydrolase [Pseudonocardia spinosispora]
MSHTVSTPDLDIAYLTSGPSDGKPLVAAHGWPDDPHCWDGVLPELHAAGYQVFRPYLRGFGETRFREDGAMRSGQIGALGKDLADFLDALDLRDVVLVGHDWGARAAYVVGSLFPDRVRRIVAISAGHATNHPYAPLSWELSHAYWYEWFVATDRGRRAMHDDRRAFCRYLWRSWSPTWDFAEADFDAAAPAWDNDDWPQITIHAYLHRWGEAPGDPAYAAIEHQLAIPAPVLCPTVMVHGGADADNLPETSEGKEHLFPNGYRRIVLDGVGHFPPREAPGAVAEAILSPDSSEG